MPSLTIDYGSDRGSLLENLRRAMIFTGSLVNIPIACLVAYGMPFFRLWVPSQDAWTLQLLCILGSFGMVLTSSVQVLFNVFTVTNHVRENAIAVIIGGVVSVVATIVLVSCFGCGVYVIVCVSSLINCVRNMVFTVPMAAVYLGLEWTTFFPYVAKSVISTVAISLLGFLLGLLFPVDGWLCLGISIVMLCFLGLFVNFYVMFARNERRSLVLKIQCLFD